MRGAAPAAGLVAFPAAGILATIQPQLAAVPLALFVLACAAAPFLPTLGFFLPIISRGKIRNPGNPRVALTFDDGPDPAVTPALLRTLAAHQVKATFFVIGKKAAAHPDLTTAILAGGHAIGNHTHGHDPLVMFKSQAALAREIDDAQAALGRLGVRPLAFRPVAGVTNPRLGPILERSGLFAVNFNCRAADFGNRRIRHLSRRIRRRLRPGAIVLLHDAAPPDPADIPLLLTEIRRTLGAIEAAGYAVVPLADLIGRPVMAPAPVSPRSA